MRYLRAHYDWPVVVVLGTIISVGLAALSYYSIERWALRQRDKSERTGKVRSAKQVTEAHSM